MNNLRQEFIIFFKTSYKFGQLIISNFWTDDCFYRASALSYTTLLALVPLMSVTLTVLSLFSIFKKLSVPIQNFIFKNFMPATGSVIEQYFQTFTGQASKLPLIGVLFLFVTSILLMSTIESAFNQIWKVKSPRHTFFAFIYYWAIVSLAPVLLAVSVLVSSFLLSSSIVTHSAILSWISKNMVAQLSPIILSAIAFTLLYYLVPNTNVKFKYALLGGIVTAVLFEISKIGFVIYITRFNSYQLLYGVFAIIPIFFVWIYWVWIITLLGAEVANGASKMKHYN